MSDAPRPALGELARLATAITRTDPDDAPWWDYETLRKAFGAADDFERDECRFIAACSPAVILQLVALATGGATDAALVDWIMEKHNRVVGGDGEWFLNSNRYQSVKGPYPTAAAAAQAGLDFDRAARSLTPERPADA